jgi:competence protein ComEA
MTWSVVWRFIYKYKITLALLLCGLLAYVYTKKPVKTSLTVDDLSSKLVESTTIMVDISGAVELPGIYELPGNARVSDLLRASKGLSKNVDMPWFSKNVNLARPLSDADKVYIPFVWDSVSDDVYVLSVDAKVISDSENSSSSLLNVNTASQKLLEELPGIGSTYAVRIIQNRSYSSIDELADNAELPSHVIDKIKDLITF